MKSCKNRPKALALLFILLFAALGILVLFKSIGAASILSHPQDINIADWERFQKEKPQESNHLKDRTRECRDMKREINKAKKQLPGEIGELETMVNNFCNAVAVSVVCVKSAKNIDDLADCRDMIQETINDIAPDIHDQLADLRDKVEVIRGIKEQKNTCKELTRRVKEISRRAKREKVDQTKLDTFQQQWNPAMQECAERYTQMKNYAEQNLYSEASAILEDYFRSNDFHEQLGEAENGLFLCAGVNKFIIDVEKGFKQAKRAVAGFKKKRKDVTAAQEILSRAENLVLEAKNALASGTCDEIPLEDYGASIEEIGQEFEEEIQRLEGNENQ